MNRFVFYSVSMLYIFSHCVIVSEAQYCVPSLLPVFDSHSPHPPGHNAIDRGTQVIFTSLIIPCNGQISSWRARIKEHKENTIHFQIWRPSGADESVYTLVGENVLTVPSAHGPGDNNDIVTMNPIERIHVRIGDVIGIYQGNKAKGVRVRTVDNPNSYIWQYRTNTSPSVGSQQIISSTDHKKQVVPLLSITIDQEEEEVYPSFSLSSTPAVPSLLGNPPIVTNVPHTQPVQSATSIPTSTIHNGGMLPTPQEQDDNETNCGGGSGQGSTVLIVVVLVLTIAILLLVVFILGTALIMVSFKLRQSREECGSVSSPTVTRSDTYVGKQVVIIEEGVVAPRGTRQGTPGDETGTRFIPTDSTVTDEVVSRDSTGTQVVSTGTEVIPSGTQVVSTGTQANPTGMQSDSTGTRIVPTGTQIIPRNHHTVVEYQSNNNNATARQNSSIDTREPILATSVNRAGGVNRLNGGVPPSNNSTPASGDATVISKTIENPSYVKRNQENRRAVADNAVKGKSSKSQCTTTITGKGVAPVINNPTDPLPMELPCRERTDSSTTTASSRGFSAQEYENPSSTMERTLQSPFINAPVVISSGTGPAPAQKLHYSIPRTVNPGRMKTHGKVELPVKCNVSYAHQLPATANRRTEL